MTPKTDRPIEEPQMLESVRCWHSGEIYRIPVGLIPCRAHKPIDLATLTQAEASTRGIGPQSTTDPITDVDEGQLIVDGPLCLFDRLVTTLAVLGEWRSTRLATLSQVEAQQCKFGSQPISAGNSIPNENELEVNHV